MVEYPRFDTTPADQAATPVVRYFSPAQFAALKRLSNLMMPRIGETPGALDAQTPEFLDFLISKSPADRQKVYTAGLDALNRQSAANYKKPYADLQDTEAAALIEPGIKQPWNYVPPADPLAHFLQVAKQDIRTATQNSREYAAAQSSAGGRRQSGVGQYWYPID